MDIFHAVVLGIIQGGTEFLPVSSSGHLALGAALLGWESPTLAFAIALHMGTLLAVVIYYYRDVGLLMGAFVNIVRRKGDLDLEERLYVRLLWMLCVALLPAGIVGVLFSDEIGRTMAYPQLVSVFLFVTAAVLVISGIVSGRARTSMDGVSLKHALTVGLLQIIALFPGISRSGSTIAGGIFSGLKKEDAARFSFLLSIPTLAAAGMLEVRGSLAAEPATASCLAVLLGFFVSFLVGFVSIKFFFALIKRVNLYVFAAYCVALGIVGLIFT